MDDFAEASLMLSAALEQLDEVIQNGHRSPSCTKSSSSIADSLNHINNNFSNTDSSVSSKMETSSRIDELDKRYGTKEQIWNGNGWSEDRRGSGASSGVESPPSDIPTSSSESHSGDLFDKFIKAIERGEIHERPDLDTEIIIMEWLANKKQSPSPSMSTVSCPEYPELQEKLQRLSMARDSLSLQVSVLSDQVTAQKEKIRDLEALLSIKRHQNIGSLGELAAIEKMRLMDGHSDIDLKKMDLMAEVSNLKLKYATIEREKSEAERKLKMSQNEIEHLSNSLHGMGNTQHLLQQSPNPQQQYAQNPYAHMVQRTKEQQDEMDQLRNAVQRLIADNEAKNHQINSLRNALDEHVQGRDECYPSPNGRWNEPPQYDFNTQLRRLLLEDPSDHIAHSTSYPVSLCSSVAHSQGVDRGARSAVQSSSSYTSSLSTASPQHSWSHSGTPRHLLHPQQPSIIPQQQQMPANSYRSPSSPAARQLAAELDELRRIGDSMSQQHNFTTASLPRGMGTKAASTLALPNKKLSLASGASAGEWSGSMGGRRNYRSQVNRWITDKLKKKKRAISVPNLVESDDEIARGSLRNVPSQNSSKENGGFRRDRTRSSLRNLFSKLTRSTSQDHGSFRRGSAARSTSTARLGSTGPLSGAIALRPAVQQFVDWKSDQIAEWMGEIGYPQYVPEVANYVRSGRHLLNISSDELEREIGIKNPLHRKRILLILRRIEEDVLDPVDKMDLHQVLKWLEDIGLPQYKDTFTEFLIDGITLKNLTAGDLVEMRVTNGAHYATICRSAQFLKMVNFKANPLEKKFDPSIVTRYPCPNSVVRWSHAATCEWLRTVDLAEFTPNLLCAGVPGAVMVYEPTFTAESLAEILQIPPHKTLIRRHLTSHFNQLLGQKLISEKRDLLAKGVYQQIMPNIRIKVVKKGFSLSRKKVKHEICLEPEEPICPPDLEHKFPMTAESLLESLDSSNV